MPVPEEPEGGGGDGGGGGYTPPDTSSGDWALIDEMVGDVTAYKLVNISHNNTTGIIDLAGTYTVLSATANTIVLSNPELVNSDWADLAATDDGTTEYASPYLSTSGERWVGPFVIDLDNLDRVLNNFVGLQGIYEISKKGTQRGVPRTVLIELTPIDEDDVPSGPAELFPVTLRGSDNNKDPVGKTLWSTPSFTGRCQIRARSNSNTNLDKDTTVVDEIRWRDSYGGAAVAAGSFGDITTAHVRTYATNSALSVKERRFNLLATRKLPQRIAGAEFTTTLHATDNVADIISAICLDPFIGRRSPAEVDFDSIYDTIAEVEAYFGTQLATEFGFTFDDRDTSFEETIATIAQAAFCTAYRQGRVIRLSFERATEESALIFNARNIMPRSQKRTVRFGVLDDHDGVELKYADPKDGAQLTYFIPNDRSAISSRELEIPGVRSEELAYWHSQRAWNKVRFQNIVVELEATQEAALVIPKDRVLIADLTRPDPLQGDVEEEDGLVLRLSQPTPLDPDKVWTIFLQHIDGTVESLGVEAGADDYHVVLGSAPRLPLSVDPINFARATYMIVPDDDVQARAFIVTERESNSDITETVRAANYSFLYYQADELVLWLSYEIELPLDGGPYERDGDTEGAAGAAYDFYRAKPVYLGTGAGDSVTFPDFDPPGSYTKAAWLYRADLATAGSILGNGGESFGFAASDQLQAGHGSAAVSAAWPAAEEWHHALVTYDADDELMSLYIDGMPVDEAADVPARTLAQLVAFDGLYGRADDLRLWKRALTASEVHSVYLGSRVSLGTPLLGREEGGVLLSEDGTTISLE